MSVQVPAPSEKSLVRIIHAIRELAQGRSNATGEFTLTESAAETTVTAINCGLNSVILLMPRTANAAAALATTYIADGDVGQGEFTVTHANNAQTDRTFGYVIQG